MSMITTIKVYRKTKITLEKFKEHEKESYDDVLKKLLYIVHVIRQNPELGKKLLKEIEETKKILERRQKYKEYVPKIVVR